MEPLFRPAQAAFQHAIDKGTLNTDQRTHMYAGNWMYMHTDERDSRGMYVDNFKNINDRRYIKVDNETPPHIDVLKESAQ